MIRLLNFSARILEKNKLFFLIFSLIILLPTNNSNYFDGLPLYSLHEYLIILIFVPFIFWSNIFSKISKNIKFLIILTLIIKIVLAFFPNYGENLKQYQNVDQLQKNKFIPSVFSFWNKNISFLKKNNWESKKNFPIDWTLASKENIKLGENNGKIKKYFNNDKEFENLSLILKSNFWIIIKEKNKFKIVANKLDNNFDNFIKVESKNNSFKFKPNEIITLDRGIYEVNYQIKLIDNNWSLFPTIINKNENIINVYKNKLIFSENIERYNINILNLINILSYIYSLTIFTVIILIIYEYLKRLNKKLIFFFIFQVFIFFLFYFVLKNINYFQFDYYGSSILSLLLLANIIYFYFKKNKKFIIENSKFIFLANIQIICLLFFLIKNYHLINTFNYYSWGDDWDMFRLLGREIILDNDWLSTREPVYYFRVLNRYLYACFYIIFGSSPFIYAISEVIVIIFSSYFLFKICKNLKINNNLSLLVSFSFLIIIFGDNFRYLIGRALPEFYALFLILIATYIFTKKNKFKISNLIFLIIIGGLGTLLREDHGLMIVTLIFLGSLNELNNRSKILFDPLFNYLILNLKYIFIYCLGVTLIFSLIFFRNYYVSGDFGLFSHPSLVFERENLIIWGRMFFGDDLPNYPRPYSLFLISAFIISIISIFRLDLINYKFALPLIIFSILIPYTFLNNMGYAPRYVIHYLPFALILNAVFFENCLRKYYLTILNKFGLK